MSPEGTSPQGIYSKTGFHIYIYGVERNWSVILSVYGADPIADVKLFFILDFTISCRLVFVAPDISLELAENSRQA
jgi:hypothetical protein